MRLGSRFVADLSTTVCSGGTRWPKSLLSSMRMGIHIEVVHAAERFLEALKGVEDPGREAAHHRQDVRGRLFRGGRGHSTFGPGHALSLT